MSAPSRRPEIRRRRTRNEKNCQAEKNAMPRHQAKPTGRGFAAKLHRLELNSPGQPLLKNA